MGTAGLPDREAAALAALRRYPASVSLLRSRVSPPPPLDAAPARADDVERWLLTDAHDAEDMLALFPAYLTRLRAAGAPLDRASLHVGALHPQIIGYGWNWISLDGRCDETQVSPEALRSPSYRRNLLFQVMECGRAARANPQDPETAAQHSLMRDLAEAGFTDYIVRPLRAGGSSRNAVSAATRAPGGFSDDALALFDRLAPIFALHVERHIATTVARNVADVYLGPAAGRRVITGAIQRGAGSAIRAVLWVSDMRGFTDLGDRLSGPELLRVLNAYFERLVGAITAQGGEVLKFMGDGLLAVFPFEAPDAGDAAARAALDAARAGLEALSALNDDPPPALADAPHWRPLGTGIALHEGEVFFGNVGAPERLDFTVIGRAVNEAARVEALSKTLKRPILITAPVAGRLRDAALEPLGEHVLRGRAAPIALFAPR